MQQEEKLTKYDYIDLLYDEPYKLAQWLGFKLITEFHNSWIKDMAFGTDDETLLAHRGSYKTTCLSVAFVIIMILFPNKTIIFTRKTDDDVIEIIKQVIIMLKHPLIRHIVKIIYSIDLELTEESSFKVKTNLATSTKGSPQLLGAGVKTSLTGKHADYVFTDDIVNVKDRVSKAERDLIKIQYQELQNIKNRGGKIFNSGTPWHKDDAIEKLMPNKKIYDCYTTGLMTRDEIEKQRQSMTSSLFAANYELKHINDEDAMFSSPVFTSSESLIYNGICHIDAAYGGTDGSALTIIKEVGDNLIVLGKRRAKHIDDCLDEFILIKNRYKGGSISCEKNADKGYLAKEIRKKNEIANTYHEDMNKYIKISTYLKKWWKNIIFLEDTDPDYINEILDYTENAEHDDSPDSLASIIRKLKGKADWLS